MSLPLCRGCATIEGNVPLLAQPLVEETTCFCMARIDLYVHAIFASQGPLGMYKLHRWVTYLKTEAGGQ